MSERSGISRIGCFANPDVELPPVTPRGRAARAGVGLATLAAAPVAATRLGGVAGRPIAVLLGWFGMSHLVAAAGGYRGCPELGAIATLLLKRPIATNCDIWDRIDQLIGASRPDPASHGYDPERLNELP